MPGRLHHTTRATVAALPLLFVAALVAWAASPIPRDALAPQPLDYRIDLNAAGPAELELLPRIGPALAEAIVAHRERIGGFTRIEQLDDVPRIGPATLRGIEPWVVVRSPDEAVGVSRPGE